MESSCIIWVFDCHVFFFFLKPEHKGYDYGSVQLIHPTVRGFLHTKGAGSDGCENPFNSGIVGVLTTFIGMGQNLLLRYFGE